MLNFEIAISNSFRDIPKNHFVTAEAEPAADIDDSIKRKRIRVSLKNDTRMVGHIVDRVQENTKAHQLVGQCETRRHSSHRDCRRPYVSIGG